MINTKKIKNLTDHVRKIVGDKFANDITDHIDSCTLTTYLSTVRNKCGLSEKELGNKINWSAHKVAKFEQTQDRNVKIGELIDYLNGLEMNIEIVIKQKE